MVADNRPAGAIGGVESRWAAVTLDGVRSAVVGRGVGGPAFVTALELSETDRNGAGDVALGLVLPCWTLLGMLDRAVELTIAHVSLRKQFGQPLSAFQGVQFQLTDAEVERSGLEILAKYALWSAGSGKPEALEDALALRMSAIEAAEVVFRVCHQLHGAVGFCDETTLSWLSRYSQPLRRLPLGLSATRDQLTRRVGRDGSDGTVRVSRPNLKICTRFADLAQAQFRQRVRWCEAAHPAELAGGPNRRQRRGIRRDSRRRGSPNCTARATPCRTGHASGAVDMPVAEQIVLYQELAAHDAPRLVLAFVGIHHAASTLLAAGTDEQRRRHLPAILDGEIWVQGFSEPEAGSDLASLRTTARRDGDGYVVNGQKLWASGGMHADWCLLLARTDPDAPKRKGISYFLLDMTTPGVEVRPIRNAIGDSHFCEIFLNDVRIPAANLVGAENAGWQVAQATLGAERGMTMLELAERLGNAGFRWLVQACPDRRPDRGRPAGAVRNRDHRPARVVPPTRGEQRGGHRRTRRRVDRQAVLQRAAAAHDGLRRRDRRPRRAHRARQVGVQRMGIRFVGAGFHRLLGVDDSGRIERDPADDHRRARSWAAARAERGLMATEFEEFHAELRSVAGDLLAKDRSVEWPVLVEAGWAGLEVPDEFGGAGADVRRGRRSICEEMGRAASANSYLGSAVLAVGVLNALQPSDIRDQLLSDIASGTVRAAVALGSLDFVPDAEGADRLLVVTTDADGAPVVVASAGLTVTPQPVVDETRRLATVSADGIEATGGAAVRR